MPTQPHLSRVKILHLRGMRSVCFNKPLLHADVCPALYVGAGMAGAQPSSFFQTQFPLCCSQCHFGNHSLQSKLRWKAAVVGAPEGARKRKGFWRETSASGGRGREHLREGTIKVGPCQEKRGPSEKVKRGTRKWETFWGDRHRQKELHSGFSHPPQALEGSPPVLIGALQKGLDLKF